LGWFQGGLLKNLRKLKNLDPKGGPRLRRVGIPGKEFFPFGRATFILFTNYFFQKFFFFL